ncbi:MAG: hypothetical protein HQRvContig01_32 [Haloquadratum phage sp.]|nr:MAG: hypothetical protein HQRvContig01_32 [Haloquadratum phage sp.]
MSDKSNNGTERKCPECGNGPEGLLFDPRPHPESNRFVCCECDHEWCDGKEHLAYGGVCPVCGDEFTDGFDDLDEGESVEAVRLCVVEKDDDGAGDGLFHLPQGQNSRSVDTDTAQDESGRKE